MTTTTPNPDNTPDFAPEIDARERLVSRIVDGRAEAEDWSNLRVLASADPEVWRDLADTQAQHGQLSAAVEDEIAVAMHAELPDEAHADHAGLSRRLEFVRSWGGWAAAAAIVLVWWTGIRVNGPVESMGTGEQAAGLQPRFVRTAEPANADDALQQYIDLGRKEGSVIAAMPEEVVLETRPLGNGSAEVLYLRQILERRVVDRFYSLATDELGRAVPVEDADAAGGARPF
jgi:hypothetical protein